MSPDHERRFVFIGGLHRSGTTLVHDLLARCDHTSVLRGTGVPKDEGQHLQDVMRPANTLGGPGRFALMNRTGAHLTEADVVDAELLRSRLLECWDAYWDERYPVARTMLEKSPPNMIRTRFLRCVFGGSTRFIIVVRHPVPVTLATSKWVRRWPDSILVLNWIRAHRILLEDLASADDDVRIVWYEDLVRRPQSTMNALCSWLALSTPDVSGLVDPDINPRYFDRWSAVGIDARVAMLTAVRTMRHFGYRRRDSGVSRESMDHRLLPFLLPIAR